MKIKTCAIIERVNRGGLFTAHLQDNDTHKLHVTPCGKMRKKRITLVVGDLVWIEISPYDLHRGRILWATMKKGRGGLSQCKPMFCTAIVAEKELLMSIIAMDKRRAALIERLHIEEHIALIKCDNPSSADKADIVKYCLLDDEIKLWSNRQISKWCGVSHQTVTRHELALRQSDPNYERPTRRKRLSNIGEIEWIETASIGGLDVVHNKSFDNIPTGSDYVYFIQCNKFMKIGKTSNVIARFDALKTANPYPITLVGVLVFDTTVESSHSEAILHKKFANSRHQREWFKLTPELENWIHSNAIIVNLTSTDIPDAQLYLSI